MRRWFLEFSAAVSLLACAGVDDAARPDGGAPAPGDGSIQTADASAEDAQEEPWSNACDLSKPNPCGVGFFCHSFLPSCSGIGKCRPTGECSIFQRFRPVCGCDGKVYATGCEAALAGVTLAPAETCVGPEKQFPCGPEFCNPLLEFCSSTRGSGYRKCLQSPPECFAKTVDSPPDCACWPEAGNFAGCRPCRIVGGTTRGLEVDCPPPVP